MIGAFSGLYLTINKETYELESIRINVSNSELSVYMHIIWDKNKLDPAHEVYNITLGNDWGLKYIIQAGI